MKTKNTTEVVFYTVYIVVYNYRYRY